MLIVQGQELRVGTPNIQSPKVDIVGSSILPTVTQLTGNH